MWQIRTATSGVWYLRLVSLVVSLTTCEGDLGVGASLLRHLKSFSAVHASVVACCEKFCVDCWCYLCRNPNGDT